MLEIWYQFTNSMHLWGLRDIKTKYYLLDNCREGVINWGGWRKIPNTLIGEHFCYIKRQNRVLINWNGWYFSGNRSLTPLQLRNKEYTTPRFLIPLFGIQSKILVQNCKKIDFVPQKVKNENLQISYVTVQKTPENEAQGQNSAPQLPLVSLKEWINVNF